MTQHLTRINRRDFLGAAGLATVAAASVGAGSPATEAARANAALPAIKLGKYDVTRLIAGYNPIGGFSHATSNLSKHMSQYFTVERTVEFLQHCEVEGINTFQFDLSDKVAEVLKILWATDTKLQFLCLHAERGRDDSLEELMTYKPFAIAHHGGVTDSLFRDGRAQQVHDFVKKVHDHGALAGVSAHNPANIKQIMDEGWENDFFMTCFQNVARNEEEMKAELGFVTVGEPFIESDRDAMTDLIRQTDKPCLAFKILAAGRRDPSEAFKYAFDHIKKTDAVIVGMFPVYQDEVVEDAGLTRKFGQV